MKAESPTPKMESASPEATWLAMNVRAATAKMRPMAMPAAIPARMPRTGLPVCTVTAKAATAPMDMMPSVPRFRTPDFSVTSSPTAAMISGVPATMVANRMAERRLGCMTISYFFQRMRWVMKTSEQSRKNSSRPWKTFEME